MTTIFVFQVPQKSSVPIVHTAPPETQPSTATTTTATADSSCTTTEADQKQTDTNTSHSTTTTESAKTVSTTYSTPAQQKLQQEISLQQAEIAMLVCRRNLNALNEDEMKLKDKLERDLKAKESELSAKRKAQQRQQKFRCDKKSKFEELCQQNPELQKQLNMRKSRGRPSVDDDQPDLLKAIVDIATYGSAADDRRRTESIRAIKTLDELTTALHAKGFNISRSGVYLRLLPRSSDTHEGKRHVTTAPVKLLRAQADCHRLHVDGKFARATINNLEELAALLGPQEVCFLSNDDKARVPIGLTAANKQAPLVMHMEYRVTLPDHDWVVATGHKLIPSVYAGIDIKPGGIKCPNFVSYSGPTYVAIRSGKHSSSTALSHASDFHRLLHQSTFEELLKDKTTGLVKPVMIVTVDGGPDENPRYEKVITVAIDHFLENDLDAYFVATNAPGRSAYNRVERRMAPLSRELAGLILPHEHFGSHLDSQGRTVDDSLEQANFAYAGQALSEVWSGMVIDGFPVTAEYIAPGQSETKLEDLRKVTAAWRNAHVRESQYFTQIVKCADLNCCRRPRSSYSLLFPERFLPPPVPLMQTPDGLRAPDYSTDADHSIFPSLFLLKSVHPSMLPRSVASFKLLPYDAYCPSVQSQLVRRMCSKCGLYHASLASLNAHLKQCGVAQQAVRVRPVRLAARRQRELMVVIAHNEDEDVEWLDEDMVDVTGLAEIQKQVDTAKCGQIKVVDTTARLTSPWTNK